MKKIYSLIFILFLFTNNSCFNELESISIPEKTSDNFLEGTTPVPESVKKNMEGIYTITDASSVFGTDVVFKWNGEYLTGFSKKSYNYAIFKCGQKNSNIYFEGFWRETESYSTGLVSMVIEKDKGAQELLNGIKPARIVITGFHGESKNIKQFDMTYIKSLPQKTSEFYIIGHRGGGRNSDRLPASENSLGMIRYAERLGANSIEIDVQLTKDGVPVLFHDEYMTNRLINETYFIGLLSEYSFPLLRTFCTLKNGERIPTLEEALNTVIDETNLKLVWIDIKGAGTITAIAPIQKKYLELAKSKGRKLEIVIGLPEELYFNEYVGLNSPIENPSLCELDEPYVRTARAKVWAPRWSLGLINDRVAQMHNEGYRIFVWTLDASELIKKFINKADFDGVCTNYPSIIAYEYYITE